MSCFARDAEEVGWRSVGLLNDLNPGNGAGIEKQVQVFVRLSHYIHSPTASLNASAFRSPKCSILEFLLHLREDVEI
jgi:hypothetical protein